MIQSAETLATVTTGDYVWIGVALGVLAVIGMTGYFLLRWWVRSDGDKSAGPTFTLAQLRELRRMGQLSDEEYEKLRLTIIGQNQEEWGKNEDNAADCEAADR